MEIVSPDKAEKIDAAFTQARIELMRHDKWTFFSALTMLLKQEVDTNPNVKDAAVSDTHTYYNSDYMLSLTKMQRVTVMAHLAMHVALKHGLRQGDCDPALYNEACDHVTNLALAGAGFDPIPEWKCDSRFRDMTVPQVYKILLDEQPPQPPQPQPDPDSGDGQGQPQQGEGDKPYPMSGDILPPEKGEDGEAKDEIEVSAEIDSKLMQAAQMVEMGSNPGNIPKDIQVYLDSLLKPKLPMAYYLRRFFRKLDKSDYSWKKINRRFAPMMIPGLSSENKLDDLVFAYDMSCSVTMEDIKRYNSEMVGVTRQLRPDSVKIVQFDTQIKSVDTVKSVKDLMALKLVGRGGTNIEPLMQWAKKNKPKALIVFTDGEYRHPETNPGCPVLWMIHGYSRERFNCDFGTIIRFEV
jgi:predicted metal-dependent peptidase